MAWVVRFVIWICVFHKTTENNMTISGTAPKRYNPIGKYSSTLSERPPASGFFVPQITEKCKRMGICEEIPNYPEEYADQLIKQMVNNKTKFNKDELKPKIALKTDLTVRELCNYSQKVITPRAARHISNEWYFILNKIKEPRQTYRVEVCDKQNVPCVSIATFAAGYEGTCIQKYVVREMTAIDKSGKLIKDLFFIPGCCSCVYKIKTK